MNYFQYQEQKPLRNTINQNLFNKKRTISKPKNFNQNLYNNYMTNYNQNTQNFEKRTKLFPYNNENFISSYNMKSYGNINPNYYQDIEILKIKMNFDLINQKINNMENIIQSMNEPEEEINLEKNRMDQMYLRDKIKYNKNMQKNRQNDLNKIQLFEKLEPNQNIFSTHHNYSLQNLKDTRYNDNYFNDSIIDENINYNNYNSVQNEKLRTLNIQKYNSSNRINILNKNNKHNYQSNRNTINGIYNKSSHSLNNNHIQNQKKIITKKIIVNKSFFDRINKIPRIKNYKNKKIPEKMQNNLINNFIVNQMINNDKKYNSINCISNRNSKSIGEYFGSFDDYFLPENQKTPSNKQMNKNSNKNISKTVRINILHKRNKNQNNRKFNIYNIVKNDKVIQNNYYEFKTKEKPLNNSNSHLIIENQNSLSYFINNKIDSDNRYKNNSDKKNVGGGLSRKKFTLNQLQKCSVTDLFLPNNSHTKLQLNLNNNNLKDDTIGIKNDKKYNNISKIIHNNNESKPYFGKSKDDFYYDLYAEKIIDIEKVNNSYEEIHLLQKLKEKYNNKFDKFLQMKPNKTIKSKIRKSVKFMESETRIIKINQKDIASKFEVYNVSGKKIFYQKCNINNYMKKLKDKNLKKKSILINKKEEFVDNSEWDKLYDIINKIAKKSDNKAFNTDNKKKFNIKNIESFKKKGKKILVKNNKSKK